MPPEASSEALYGLLEVAGATEVEVMARGWMSAVTERVSVALAVRAGAPASVTVKVTGKLPVVVGVPERMPSLARTSPAGRALADQV